jgi:dipeptidyl-peptidase 4
MLPTCLLAGLAICLVAPPDAPAQARGLTLEQVYRVKPYLGQAARGMEFSHSRKFLAYLWNPYGENGSDLYVHDVAAGQMRRLTSLDLMKAYDAPEDLARFLKKATQKETQDAERQAQFEAQQAYLNGAKVDLGQWEKAQIELLKKETAEKKAKEDAVKKTETDKPDVKPEAKKEKEKEKEDWEWRDELKKKLEKDKLKPGDLYPGVSAFVWAHNGDELIFQYRGDLFRYLALTGKVERLTMSDRQERIVAYTPGDEGYFFADESRVFKASFSGAGPVQVNRELINSDDADKKYRIAGTSVSENGKWLAIQASALPTPGPDGTTPPPQVRQVQIMDYTKRFAESKRVPREVPDDKRTIPATALFIRSVPTGTSYGRQPEPVFTHPGGDVWFENSPITWAKDGTKYTFSTWEREKELLRIYVGRAEEGARPEIVLERKGNVGHEVVDVVAPQFTPDGKTLVAVLDEGGTRQPYIVDTAAKTARPLLKGGFEAPIVVGFTQDSQTLFVASNREDPAMMNIYAVSLGTGEMTPIGLPGGMHRATAMSEDGRLMASMYGNWGQRPELLLIDRQATSPKVLTNSHDKAWDGLGLPKPELFKFTNRHGDKLSGLVFKPAGWKASDRRPGVVYVYGGPLGLSHTVETDTFHGSTYLFSAYMAAKHGYVMVAIDPRGQSNYDRKFSDANWEQAGRPQVEDLEDLVAHLRVGFGVDTARLGLHGWSFGGFQTQMTLYTSPDTFACGIAGAGPTEWENYNSWYSGRTIGVAERGKPSLRKFSLIPLARNLKKPLLLMHGMDDANVLYQDTVNVYRALLESGKEVLVDLFVDPEGAHGLGGAVQRKGMYRKMETFFLAHLGGGKK